MQLNPDLPIALFDSGVGGLTVFKAISGLLPAENLLYLGDTARVPYGTKSPDTIIRYTLNSAKTLAARGAKMLVIACNTATSIALRILCEHFAPIPVVGVLLPGAQAATEASRNGKIAVIATEATISGGAYQRAICALRPDAAVVGRACTLFVPLAEEGWIDGPVPQGVARRYLSDIFEQPSAERPDTLLLGCTHFPLFRDTLQQVVGREVAIVDSAAATARSVFQELERRNLLRSGEAAGSRHFLTTDNVERFIRTGRLFLGCELTDAEVELVDL